MVIARGRATEDTPLDPSAARIVSLSPGMTETLFALGLGGNVVGRSDYCDYPEKVRELPGLGTAITPNLESKRSDRCLGGADAGVANRQTPAAGVGCVHLDAPGNTGFFCQELSWQRHNPLQLREILAPMPSYLTC